MRAADDEPLIHHAAAQKPNLLLGGTAALVAAGCMSAYVLIGERTTKHHDAAGFLLLRQLLASVCMVLLAWARHGLVHLFGPPQSERANVRLLGLLQFLNAILFLHGLSFAGSFVTAVCQLSIPVITFVYTAIAGLERPSTRRTLAMLAVILGCALTACGRTLHESAIAAPPMPTDTAPLPRLLSVQVDERNAAALRARIIARRHQRRRQFSAAELLPMLGVALLLAQCASFVGIVVVQKRVLRTQPVSLVVLWSYGVATLYTAGYCLLTGSVSRLGAQISSTGDAFAIAFAAIAGSVCYFELVGIATKHLPPTLVACSVALEPLAVSALGAILLGHVTTPLELGGYAIASLGACALAMLVEREEDDGHSVDELAHVRRSPSGPCIDDVNELLPSHNGVVIQQHVSSPSGTLSPRSRSTPAPHATAGDEGAGLVLAMASQPGG